jgi:hypothetical protein
MAVLNERRKECRQEGSGGRVPCLVQLGGSNTLVVDEVTWVVLKSGLEFGGVFPSTVDEQPLSCS